MTRWPLVKSSSARGRQRRTPPPVRSLGLFRTARGARPMMGAAASSVNAAIAPSASRSQTKANGGCVSFISLTGTARRCEGVMAEEGKLTVDVTLDDLRAALARWEAIGQAFIDRVTKEGGPEVSVIMTEP